MSLREVHEHEHCAYISARTPVRFANDDGTEDRVAGDVLAVFRKSPVS